MTLRLTTAMRSVTGPHRASNQDSVGCSDDYVFVADGVGGHVGGDVASWTVTHRLMSALAPRHSRDLDTDELRIAIAQANAELSLRVQREPALAGMATTFTGLFCSDGAIRIAHIGDSRAFMVRDGAGRRMTRDDSWVQLLVDSGAIRPDEADHHPNRNVILRSLAGSLADTDGMTLLSVPAQAGDRWLVASDGLTDYLPEPQVIELLAAAASPDDACATLVDAALAADSRDNVTVAVSDVVESQGSADRPHRYLGAAASDKPGTIGDLSR